MLRCAAALATPTPLRIAYFSSPRMRQAVRQEVASFSPDVIYVERWRALQFVPCDLEVPIVCDPTDSMLLYNLRLIKAGSWWEKAIGIEEALKFLRFEPYLCKRAAATVFCSAVDLEFVRKRSAVGRFTQVCNGVDCEKFFLKKPEEEEESRIVFTGSFTYGPNRHAVKYFLKSILPIVRQRVPTVRFSVIGNQAGRCFGHLGQRDNIEVLDFVPELRPYVARATVAVAPLNVGVGVTNKVIEAFATGTAVVATSLACGDLPVRDGEHFLRGDSSTAFAENVIRVLLEPNLRRHLVLNARKLVEEAFDWKLVAARMEGLMQEVARGNARSSEQATIYA